MLISAHRVPTVLRRRFLYGGKPSPRRLTNKGQCGPTGGRGVRRESKHRRKGMAHHCTLRERLLGGILMLMTFPGKRALVGLCPERLPTKPPPARLQHLVRRGRRAQGASQMLLQRRMPTGCLPPGLRWRALRESWIMGCPDSRTIIVRRTVGP